MLDFFLIYLLASRVFSCSRWKLFGYGMKTLSRGMRDPRPGIELGPPALELKVLVIESPGKSP